MVEEKGAEASEFFASAGAAGSSVEATGDYVAVAGGLAGDGGIDDDDNYSWQW